jgi:hypothetical protein
MTIRRFRKIVGDSNFRFERFEPVPIRRLRWLSNPLTQEFTTAVVRCKLVPKTCPRRLVLEGCERTCTSPGS